MLTEIVLLIVIALLLAVVIAQSYWLFLMAQTGYTISAAPDASTIRTLLTSMYKNKSVKFATAENYKVDTEVSPGDLSPEAIANLRNMQ
jgi:hypothetical protein